MKQIKTLAFVVFCCFAGNVFAQYQPKNFEVKLENTLESISKAKSYLKSNERKLQLGEVNGFKYEAFFCRMEQKAINKWGVCIQVHAGDYNSYYKDRRDLRGKRKSYALFP